MFYLSKWICVHCLAGFILCLYVFRFKDAFSNTKHIPTITWWTPFVNVGDRYIQCHTPNRQLECLVTNERGIDMSALHAIVFYGSRLTSYDFPLPRSNNALWSLYHEESPKNFPALLHWETQRLFNVTATFSRNSDFPLTLQYLNNVTLLTDTKYYSSVEEKNLFLPGLAPVVYIQSNCESVTARDELVKELMKFIKVDSYGKCLNNKKLPERLEMLDPLDIYNEELLYFIAKYKFVISFENAACEDYISEKLWRPLIVGSIPIYLGSPTVEDWLPNKKSAVLVKDFHDTKTLAEYINRVDQNATLYNSYMDHKLFGRVSNDQVRSSFDDDKGHAILNFECFICRKLHENGSKSKMFVTKNIFNCLEPKEGSLWHDHWRMAKHQSKMLGFKIKENKPFSREEYEKSLLD